MRIFMSAALLLATGACFAQKITIHGKVELLSKSQHILIAGLGDCPIKADGTFEITGEKPVPGIGLIRTDSSGAAAIWLEAGDYTIGCKEHALTNQKGIVFRIPSLKGPGDAHLYNDFQDNEFNSFGLIGDCTKDAGGIKNRRKQRVIHYLDSVFAISNTAPVLPAIVRSVQFYIGDEATQGFIQKLSPDLRNDGEIITLQKDFDRKAKIRKEKFFENFTLKDTSGRDFSLSSLSDKKVILIDFWASDCGPCRMSHPRLKELYKKYADKGLAIVSISIDDNKDKWLKAVKDDGIGGWVNVDDERGWDAALVKSYFIPYIPFKFMLNSSKLIVGVENQADSWITEKDIVALLDK